MKGKIIEYLKRIDRSGISEESFRQTLDRIKKINKDFNLYKYLFYAVNFRQGWKGKLDAFLEEYDDLHDTFMRDSNLDSLENDEEVSSIEISAFANSYNINHGMILFSYNRNERLIIKATIMKDAKYDNKWIEKNNMLKYHLQKPPANGDYMSNKVNAVLIYSLAESLDIPVYVFVRYTAKNDYLYKGIFNPIKYDGDGYVYLKRETEISAIDIVEYEKNRKNLFRNEVGLYTSSNGKRRLGQGIFRKALLRESTKCAVCNVEGNEFLFASHIKPYSECEKGEHVDVNNGLLLCPVHDFLFDKHLISFDVATGEIIVADRLKKSNFLKELYTNIQPINISDNMRKYIMYHNEVFNEKNN